MAIPSPRNIPEVANAVDDYLSDQFDVAWFKFYPQVAEPYHKIRSYFLSRKKYTHLAILPDDLVINEGVYKVIDLAQRWPDRYRVAMGNCNFEYNSNGKLACGQDGSPFCAFTHTLPALERVRRKYTWYTVKEVKKFKGQPIRVLHCGTSFAILRRDVVEAVTLDTDQAWNKNDSVGTSEDVVLS